MCLSSDIRLNNNLILVVFSEIFASAGELAMANCH